MAAVMSTADSVISTIAPAVSPVAPPRRRSMAAFVNLL